MALIEQSGRFKTVRTDEELLKLARNDLEALSPAELSAFEVILADLRAHGRSPALDYASSMLYRTPPVSMETWLSDPYYCGSFTKDLFPLIRQDLIELFTGQYEEALIGGSIGAGKSTFARLAMLRQVYEASCLHDPHEAYGVAKGDMIAFPCIAVTEDQAHELVFEKIKVYIETSPYFQNEFRPVRVSDEAGIIMPNGLWIPPGLSTERRTLGINAFGAVIEEANFFKSNKNTNPNHNVPDMAEAVYKSIKRRMQSRFLAKGRLPGKLIMISSKTSVNSFTERRIKEAADNPLIMVREHAVYEVAPDRYSKERFRVAIGNETKDSRILIDGEPDPEGMSVVDVPVEFRQAFEDDINSAIREICGMATNSISPYIARRERIIDCIDLRRSHPFNHYVWSHDHTGEILWDRLVKATKEGGWEPIFYPKMPRFVSIDMSKSGDATGFAMGCIGPYVPVKRLGSDGTEMAPSFHLDFVLRIEAATKGEVVQSEIRSLIYQLSAHGFYIKCVSADTFQSVATLQALRGRGYNTKEVSVDRTIVPYEIVKQAIYENRLSFYRYDPLIKELRELQKDWKRNKIDHPDPSDVAGASKDVSDAVAQLCFQLAEFSKNGIAEAPLATNVAAAVVDDDQWILENAIAVSPERPQTGGGQEAWREEAQKRLAQAQPSTYDGKWKQNFSMPFDIG